MNEKTVCFDGGTQPYETLAGEAFHDADAADRFGHLFHLIDDAVVEIELVDVEPIVRAVNPAFEELFGYDREAIIGEPLNEFIVPDGVESRSVDFDRRTAEGKPNSALVKRQTTTGIREFLYRGVPYEGPEGRRFGFAIYSDITEQRVYERHSQVIHRILRHNLRNDLAVIMAMGSHLQSTTTDPAVQDAAETITQHAERISATGEEMQTLETVLTERQSASPLNVAALCRDAVESVAAHHSDDICLDVPLQQQAMAVPELTDAIRALVDNAVIHGEPPVTVHLSETDRHVAIDILDEGDGIPEHETGPVFDDRDITPLDHGSGIGLWLARWTAAVCGGDLQYDRTAAGRTRLRLTLRPVLA